MSSESCLKASSRYKSDRQTPTVSLPLSAALITVFLQLPGAVHSSLDRLNNLVY